MNGDGDNDDDDDDSGDDDSIYAQATVGNRREGDFMTFALKGAHGMTLFTRKEGNK